MAKTPEMTDAQWLALPPAAKARTFEEVANAWKRTLERLPPNSHPHVRSAALEAIEAAEKARDEYVTQGEKAAHAVATMKPKL